MSENSYKIKWEYYVNQWIPTEIYKHSNHSHYIGNDEVKYMDIATFPYDYSDKNTYWISTNIITDNLKFYY